MSENVSLALCVGAKQSILDLVVPGEVRVKIIVLIISNSIHAANILVIFTLI